MPSDLALIAKTLHSLSPALADDKCAGCECLQGALVELKLALEELPGDTHRAELLAQVETALGRGERHACLGCEPCNPGNILAGYYREQQAREVVPQIACTDG
jgi:hypothetical protein